MHTRHLHLIGWRQSHTKQHNNASFLYGVYGQEKRNSSGELYLVGTSHLLDLIIDEMGIFRSTTGSANRVGVCLFYINIFVLRSTKYA